MIRMHEPPELLDLLQAQAGLVSRAQLTAIGVTASTVRWRLRRHWRAVMPGVIATFTGALDPYQRLVAAQLFAGPSAVISSWTAAAWHGVESARVSPILRLTVLEPLATRRSGSVLVSRSTRPDPAPWNRGPLQISSRARAVVDAAREVREDRRAGAIVVEAVQRRIVTVPALRHELELGPRRDSAKVRRAIDAAEAGAWSLPEVDLQRTLSQSSLLPELWLNPQLTSSDGTRLPTPDGWIDEVGLALQVHSRTYHLRDQEWEATVSADSALGECGIVVLGVTPDQLATSPRVFRQRAERAYQALRTRPRPRVHALPRRLV